MHLTAHEEAIAAALSAAAIPAGSFLPAGGAETVQRFRQWLDGAPAAQVAGVRALLWGAEMAALARTGRRLTALDRPRAERFLVEWQASPRPLLRALLRATLTPLKAAHFDDPSMLAHVGCPPSEASRAEARPRWMDQVTDGRAVHERLALECEVVVVGTGAGGAACAYELARRGRAVLLVEEGDYHLRSAFTSRASSMVRKLYRDRGLTIALGNAQVPVWAGRAVGGSTVINSGTCYRAPSRIFRRWQHELGLEALSEAAMAPYYERVEQMLQVAPAAAHLTGGVGRVIARGASALGLRHGPLVRNAPACDGQGVCCFGCPTGAKRSTDVSYVPEALKRGAALVTAATIDRIDVQSGRARGVSGRLASGARIDVRAEAVVVAGGALMTPVLLQRAGVCRASRALGRNLSIHPASKVMAVFDETIDMASAIPQGYAVDALEGDGIVFEGASMPLDVTAVANPWVGRRYMDFMEAYRHVATFGFMIEDTSRGRVRKGPGGSPLVTYDLNRDDTAKMARAIGVLCEIYLAAGARRVLPLVAGADEIRTPRDLDALRARRVAPGDIEVTAFHPLGTCRIGVDPETSVLGPDHQAHALPGLYVTDGSAVPTPLGVNPQMTIMAMALRAAELLDARLARD